MNLRDYLDQHGIKYNWFIEKCFISWATIHKIFSGGTVNRNTAKRIEEMTNGEVKAESIMSEKGKDKGLHYSDPRCQSSGSAEPKGDADMVQNAHEIRDQ